MFDGRHDDPRRRRRRPSRGGQPGVGNGRSIATTSATHRTIDHRRLSTTPTADTADLLASANTATLKAYRGLIAAVPVLDGIASLRMQMATIAGIGSPDLPVANFSDPQTVSWSSRVQPRPGVGEVERVQYDLPGLGGSYLAKQARPRLGGRWLICPTSRRPR